MATSSLSSVISPKKITMKSKLANQMMEFRKAYMEADPLELNLNRNYLSSKLNHGSLTNLDFTSKNLLTINDTADSQDQSQLKMPQTTNFLAEEQDYSNENNNNSLGIDKIFAHNQNLQAGGGGNLGLSFKRGFRKFSSGIEDADSAPNNLSNLGLDSSEIDKINSIHSKHALKSDY